MNDSVSLEHFIARSYSFSKMQKTKSGEINSLQMLTGIFFSNSTAQKKKIGKCVPASFVLTASNIFINNA